MDFLTDPWHWWVSPFLDNDYMQTALWASLLAVLCTSVIGTWVVLRGMSFLGDALAHGVLPGIALALVMGWSTTLGGFAAALLMVGLVSLIRSRSPLPEDTSIGIVFVGFLALALVIVSSSNSVSETDLEGFLFGSVLSVSGSDLKWQGLAVIITLLGVVVFYRPLLALVFDERKAQLLGLRPRVAHAVLLALVSISVVASFEVVGSLLVFAFLIAPPAAASLLVRRVPLIMVTASSIAAVSALVGLLLSYHHDTAPGATMALVSVAFFMASLVARSIRHPKLMPTSS